MGISRIIRGVGHGVSAAAGAVQAASRKLDQLVAPSQVVQQVAPQAATALQPAQVPAPTMQGSPTPATAALSEGTPKPSGFTLPDLGPGPDATKPEYQDEMGKKKLEADMADYKHKMAIHDAYQKLDKIYADAHPGRDFQKEYQESLTMQKQHGKERPEGNAASRFALALGDFNPAVQQSGQSNLARYEQNVAGAQEKSDSSFSQRMVMRQKMHEQAAAEAQTQGNWKKALKESEMAALLKVDSDSQSHKNKMEEEGVKQGGATERAQIRASAAKQVATTRAKAVGAAHGLQGTFLQQFQKAAAAALARRLSEQDITKDAMIPQDKMDDYIDEISQYASMFQDQQDGEGASDTHFNTHPGSRPKPKSGGKEQF